MHPNIRLGILRVPIFNTLNNGPEGRKVQNLKYNLICSLFSAFLYNITLRALKCAIKICAYKCGSLVAWNSDYTSKSSLKSTFFSSLVRPPSSNVYVCVSEKIQIQNCTFFQNLEHFAFLHSRSRNTNGFSNNI